MLDALLRKALLSGGTTIVKIIHGYGSSGKGGILRTAVRNWAWRNRSRICLCLPGEEADMFNAGTRDLIEGTGLSASSLGPPGAGHTFIRFT